MSASTHGAPGQRLQQDAKREPFPAERGADMLLAKARWFNDAQAAVALTIDDLSYGYLDPTGVGLGPFNDWGYGCRREGSVFRYFEEHFLARVDILIRSGNGIGRHVGGCRIDHHLIRNTIAHPIVDNESQPVGSIEVRSKRWFCTGHIGKGAILHSALSGNLHKCPEAGDHRPLRIVASFPV